MKRSNDKREKIHAVSAKQRQIVESILAQVPFDGWTENALRLGLKNIAMSRRDAEALIADGIPGIVRVFFDMIDQDMKLRIDATPRFDRMRTRDKIAFAVRVRLEFLTPHREAMKRLATWQAMPHRLPAALNQLKNTADLIWTKAGDTSTDYNFYTKRLLLIAVMKTTFLFWLHDDTPNNEATWLFLDRRINEIIRLGKTISLAKEWSPADIFDIVKSQLKRV